MTRIQSLAAALPVILLLLGGCQSTSDQSMKITYPETFQDSSVVDDYFGTLVADPYRWLEDDLSAETADWVARQNAVTFGYLEKIPFREALKSRLETLWNYEKISAPFKEGDFIYYYKNDGLQNQSVLYRQRGEAGEPEIFLDPNTFSEGGTTSLAGIDFSEDGSLLAYAISEGGSDWRKIIVMNAESKEILEDTLVDVKFSGISWKGNEGFYYSSYDRPKGSELSAMTDKHKLYYHQLGTPQSSDVLVFGGEKTPRRYIGGYVTEDQRYLIISAAISTTGNELYIQDLSKPNSPIIPIVDNFDFTHSILHTEGTQLFITTNLNAPNRKIVVADVSKPTASNWKDLLPETEMPLSASTAGGYIFASYLKDATSQILQYNLKGEKIREIALPAVGSAGGFGAKMQDSILYYSFTNYVYPSTLFKLNIAEGTSELYRRPDVKFNPEEYVSEQVFYTSKDGTKVPMIITHRKDVQKNGKNPTILYGYGGFNISLTPSFSIALVAFLEQGGVYAVPNLRGGGEYGKAWHDGGRQMKKQNVFDDFIAAGEYLINNQFTSPQYLAIRGGSNGGLLVGACMAQRPDLFQVALPAVGVMDMLRYHTFTAGAGWAYDYGTSADSKEMFEYLYKYSPVHALKEGTNYPATLVTTADHDDRVVPAHSFKFAARLQATTTGERPALIRIDTKAGHGAGKPTSMIIQEQADIFAFTLYNMGWTKLPRTF
jgi:prolyl oligopeptidase